MPQKLGNSGFPSPTVERVLASMTHPLAPYMEAWELEDPEFELNLDPLQTINGGNIDRKTIAKVKYSVTLSGIAGWAEPITAAIFAVLKVDWLGDGTDIGYYSEADLATDTYQLHGKITSIGSFTRAFGVDHSIRRSTITLHLEDIDRVFATKVRSNVYLNSRFTLLVGSPYAPPHRYTGIATGYRVQDVSEISETEVALTLIDGVEDMAGISISPPQVGDVGPIGAASTRSALGWDLFGESDLWNVSEMVKVVKRLNVEPRDTGASLVIPFAGSFYRAPFAANYVPEGNTNPVRNQRNPVAVIVLGASKNPEWMRPHYYGACKDGPASGRPDSEPIIYAGSGSDREALLRWDGDGLGPSGSGFAPNGTYGIRAYIDVVKRWAQLEGGNVTAQGGATSPWYVAVLTINLDPRPLDAAEILVTGITLYRLGLEGKMKQLARAMALMKAHLGDIWIDSNGYGASNASREGGPPPPFERRYEQGAIGAIEYLARYHSGRGLGALYGADRLIDSTADARTAPELMEPVGGFISETTSGDEVLSGIGASFHIDQGVSGRGRLLMRPLGVTMEDRYGRIPTAREYRDELHIIEGSWKEIAPKGSDRWGFGTLFAFTGLQEQTTGTRFERLGKYKPGTHAYTQEVDKALDISWRRQDGTEESKRLEWAAPFQNPRFGAEFSVPIGEVLDIDLGSYCYVTHYAGSNADGTKGWDRRLCRVDSIGYDLGAGTADLTVIDWRTDYDAKPWVLDDAGYWEVVRPRYAGQTVTLTAASPVATFAASVYPLPASSWAGLRFRISRQFRLWPNAVPSEAQCGSWEILSVNVGARQITLDADYPDNVTAISWRVMRGHVNAPDDPYRYPFGSDAYGRLCDAAASASDGSNGAFSNSDPGYHLRDN